MNWNLCLGLALKSHGPEYTYVWYSKNFVLTAILNCSFVVSARGLKMGNTVLPGM